MNDRHLGLGSTRGRVLVTGSHGAVGRAICPFLKADGWTIRGLDRNADNAPEGLDEMVVGDITDPDAVGRAMQDVDVLIHLAAHPNPEDFLTVLLPANVAGLYNVLHAATEVGVKRVILTSTVQVVGGWRDTSLPRRVDEASPRNYYALTKLWAEQAGDMYARTQNASVITVRLGWLVRDLYSARRVKEMQSYAIYLSHDDAGRFYTLAASANLPPAGESAVLFCFSKTAEGPEVFDLEPSRRTLGYEPQDVYPAGLPWPADEVLMPAGAKPAPAGG